jgi:hypothetical protein
MKTQLFFYQHIVKKKTKQKFNLISTIQTIFSIRTISSKF